MSALVFVFCKGQKSRSVAGGCRDDMKRRAQTQGKEFNVVKQRAHTRTHTNKYNCKCKDIQKHSHRLAFAQLSHA